MNEEKEEERSGVPRAGQERPDHQKRVIIERDELNAKCNKLSWFLIDRDKDKIPLDGIDEMLMWAQLRAMQNYSSILLQRIKGF